MRTINDFLVVEPINEEIKLDSGMVVAQKDMNDVRYVKGIVKISSSEIPSDLVKAGDTIMYDKNNSHQAFVNSEKLTFIRRRDVVVVL
jgi:co-chaperonin GroES (HSP10)